MLKHTSSSRQCSLQSPAAKKHLAHNVYPTHRLHCARMMHIAAAAVGPVLVHDGVAVPAPATPQLLLTQHRQASYTTALAKQGQIVVDWELHLQRLVRNAELLGQERSPTYAQFLVYLQQQHRGESASAAAALDAVIRPQVARALQLLAAADEQQQQQQQKAQAMVTVVITDPQSSPKGRLGGLPLSVLVWAKQLPHAAAPNAAKVLVSGGPREVAQAKHCEWALQRQPLEQLKQQTGVDEVLLSDSSGVLLEGLVSNFFVVAEEAALGPMHDLDDAAADLAAMSHPESSQAAASSASPSSSSSSRNSTAGLVLLTAGPDHAALPGVSQARVLQACQQLQLKVLQQPARLKQRHAWREAFLTNCVKGILPVASVQLPDGAVWQAPSTGSGNVTQLLQQVVTQLQSTTDMSM